MKKIKTIEDLQDYIALGEYDTETLLNALSSTIIINETMCHMKIWRGNHGWTICYNSNDKTVGTPNISTKRFDINSACLKALEYLIENKFHHLQNKDRNIFLDMLTVKN
jgi:hypothetical protein